MKAQTSTRGEGKKIKIKIKIKKNELVDFISDSSVPKNIGQNQTV